MFDFNTIEPEVLDFWRKNNIYQKARRQCSSGKEFYFLDGPPYTSGKVHIGTAWNKALKDMVLRYKRMRGFNVWDRAGYDMHGLPIENKVQNKLNLKFKEDIERYGMSKFINECKDFAVTNLHIMNQDFIRLGVWMDFENAYQSVSPEYIEGEWWLIKKAHENKRLYLGKKSMAWCHSCETALAKHELEYQNVTENSIFVKLKVVGTENEYLIIWTTTPWTIAYNLAVMANPEYDYVKAKVEDEVWILAKALVGPVVQAVADRSYKLIEEFKGEDIDGLKYEHPFYDILHEHYDEISSKSSRAFSVVMSKEYVDVSAGTGLVHCAPGCGPEDFEVGHKYDIPAFNNLTEGGLYPDSMGEFSGMHARKDNDKFTEELDRRKALIATTKVEHEYPHCWRCKQGVIFKTTDQWFFKIEDLRENMRELNKDFEWIPEWAGARQFDSWLENLRDNGITRQRFWGTPLPIWKCDCGRYDVIENREELKRLSGTLPEDLHIPWIDDIKYKCDCGKEKKRVPDVLDVWIDAGSSSWNCLDYPKRTDLFERLFPADFILEGKDQIRGWFNLLFVASMVSMQKPSFKSVYMHGFVQDSEGRKMSKSLGNVISPYEVIDRYGADTLRYYMIGGAKPGVDLNYNFDDMKVKHKNLSIIWNIHQYIINFAKELNINPEKIQPKRLDIEEQYILSRLHSSIKRSTELMERYELSDVPWVAENLILDLSRTYIQLVRDKAAIGKQEEKEAVLYCIYTVLLESLKLFAPVIPLLTENIYQNLRETFSLGKESIHLFSWPNYDDKLIHEKIENEFESVKSIIQSVLFAREKIQLGLRWPLKEIVIETTKEDIVSAFNSLTEIIKTQTNAKEINIVSRFSKVSQKIKADSSRIGQDFGRHSPKLIAQFAIHSPENILRKINERGKFVCEIDNQEFELKKEHLIIDRNVPEPYKDIEFKGGTAYLNYGRTNELDAEGYAREIMRRVQSARKKAGMQKSDRIDLHIQSDEETAKLILNWHEQIAAKCGASGIRISYTKSKKDYPYTYKEKVKGKEFVIGFEKL